MSRPVFDVDRFEKCLALMRGGATAGERAAGEAAATRVAAAVGLSLAEALARIAHAERAAVVDVQPQAQPRRERPGPRSRSEPAAKSGPVTIEELLAAKARRAEWLKRKAVREAKRLREIYAAQEAEATAIREEQARRDREWAEKHARTGRPSEYLARLPLFTE